jgi:hypothetical protein
MKKLITVSILLLASSAFAKDHPYSPSFELRVRDLFLQGTQPAPSKIDRYINRLETKRSQLVGIFENKLREDGEKNLADIKKDIKKNKINQAFYLAIKRLEQLKTEKDLGKEMELAKEALDLESAIRIEGVEGAFKTGISQLGNYLKTWKLDFEADASEEATNLFDPKTKSYLSAEQIQELKDAEADLSTYGPGPVSTFWQDLGDIEKVSVKEASLGKNLKAYEDSKLRIPDDMVFMYDGIKPSDSKPKMDVFVRTDSGKKGKFKLKFGAELHADPTLAALSMTLGYPADITKYARDVKVIIGKNTVSDVTRDWELFYKRDATRQAFKIEDYIKDSGVDADGQNYIIFKETLIEMRPSKIDRLGSWAWGEQSNDTLREVRGLTLVQMWLDNTDLKEFDNNKLLVKDLGDNKGERYHIISDLGHSFGGDFFEMPELYSSKMISKFGNKSLTFKYRGFKSVSIKNEMTYADARWAARLIAALTRSQMEEALKIGNWPECIAKIYIEKMISRRNDLVQHLNLIGETLPSGKKIALLPMTATEEELNYDLKCDKEEIAKDYGTVFDYNSSSLVKPIAKGLGIAIADLTRGLINSSRTYTLADSELGFVKSQIAQVILNFRREIERNERPTSEKDIYIVKDHLEVGLRLGVAYGAFADATYTRSYTLAYPMRTMAEARTNNGFLVNVLLPRDIRNGNLPEQYVLKTEHFIENGAGVEFDNLGSPVSVGVRAKVSKVMLMRSILDHKNPQKITVYRDSANFPQLAYRAFLKLAILRLPFLEGQKNWGHAYGAGSVFTSEQLAQNPGLQDQIDLAVTTGDFTGVAPHETKFQVDDKFNNGESKWNLLFFGGTKNTRLDVLSVGSTGEQTETIQYRMDRSNKATFFGNTERRNIRVEVYSDPKQISNDVELRLTVSNFDSNTRDKDLGDKYIRFINELSTSNKPMIPLDPSLGYTTNGKWGRTFMESKTTYYAEGMVKLTKVSEDEFWSAVARAIRINDTQMDEVLRLYRSSRADLTPEVRNILQNSHELWKNLQKLRKIEDKADLVRALAKTFRSAIFVHQKGFYDARVIQVINRLVGEENYYSHNVIDVPKFEEPNLIDEAPMFGFSGSYRQSPFKYLVFAPTTASDLYFMLDNWIAPATSAPIAE